MLSGARLYQDAALRRRGNVCMLTFNGLTGLAANSLSELAELPEWARPPWQLFFDETSIAGNKFRFHLDGYGKLRVYNYQSTTVDLNVMNTLVWAV